MKKKKFVIPLSVTIITVLVIGSVYVYSNQQQKTLVSNQVENNSVKTSNSSTNTQTTSLTQNQSQTPTIISTSPVMKNKNSQILEGQNFGMDFNEKINPDNSASITQLVFVSPNKQRIVIPNDVGVKISSAISFIVTGSVGNEDEDINGVIQNPQNQNQIIITTRKTNCTSSSNNQQNCLAMILYNYDKNLGILKKIYAGNPQDLSGENPELIPVATQSSKIILKAHIVGTDNICGGRWSDAVKYYSFDLADTSSGLQVFNVPDVLIKRDRAAEAVCQANL